MPHRSSEPTADATFIGLFEPHRRAIRTHCYRMVASVEDAEDLTQETLIRAWQRMDSLRGAASARPWLYRIATNVCLDHLARVRRRRVLPRDLLPANLGRDAMIPAAEVAWLEPAPTAWLETIPDPAESPDAAIERGESVRLAFVAALQHLPPRQRAVVLLLDVLGWKPPEAAAALGTSVAAVNSALQRGRASLRTTFPTGMPERIREPARNEEALLHEYIRCWESDDLVGLARLLTSDVTLNMPPSFDWYQGAHEVIEFFRWAWSTDAGLGPFRLLPTSANGESAIALYGGQSSTARSADKSCLNALALKILTTRRGLVSEIAGFVRPDLFPRFGLPMSIEA